MRDHHKNSITQEVQQINCREGTLGLMQYVYQMVKLHTHGIVEFLFCGVVSQLNNNPRFDLGYRTLDEKYKSVDHQNDANDYSKNIHPFGCPVYVLNNKL